MARGSANRDARTFTVTATLGSPTAGIISGRFLDENFRTLQYPITTVNADSFTYEQGTVLLVAGRPEPFHHTDQNTLRRVAAPAPNPAAMPRQR